MEDYILPVFMALFALVMGYIILEPVFIMVFGEVNGGHCYHNYINYLGRCVKP